ncbi:MAG: hypothetical protein Q7J98_04660 [Kiritimatiellia bacterium]|nr:hypothetical protein [Kiritimatiellia bacterium]
MNILPEDVCSSSVRLPIRRGGLREVLRAGVARAGDACGGKNGANFWNIKID